MKYDIVITIEAQVPKEAEDLVQIVRQYTEAGIAHTRRQQIEVLDARLVSYLEIL